MSTTLPHAPGEFGEPPATAPGRGPGYYAFKALKAVASLQLTVGLLALGVVLVFFGTLAQLDNGIWTVVEDYFAANFESFDAFVGSLFVMIPFDLIRKFLGVFWKESFPPVPHGSDPVWAKSFPFPNGFLIGGLMLINLLAAHAIRFRISWKRIGIFMIHIGIILLLVGELITRVYSVEQQMTVTEGASANYTEDTRHVELAFVSPATATTDHVTVVPQKLIQSAKPGARITHPDLPVDVEVLQFMKNADFKDPGRGLENRATTGAGLSVVAVPRREEAGVETKQRGDFASAYVRLYKKGTDEDLGVHLVSLLMSLQGESDTVTVGDSAYQMTLRRARIYKPYTVFLDKFRFDRYEGTSKAKNYSSDVRIKDADGVEVRAQRIAMNEPLRYAGETFYQSSFDKTETTTILQVVKNPGWLLPYVSCVMVGLGLVVHFGLNLVLFLRRKQARAAAAAPESELPAPEGPGGPVPSRVFPWVMLGVAGFVLIGAYSQISPRSLQAPYDIDAFARAPVLEGGRVKPIESMARVYLRTVSHRETFVDENGVTQPAVRWYLDLIASESPDDGSPVWKYKVFRIENDQVRAELKLELREGLRYSLAELRPRLRELFAKAAATGEKMEAKKPVDLTESKMYELAERVQLVVDISRFRGQKNQGKDTFRQLPPDGNSPWRSFADFREKQTRDAELVGVVEAQKAIQSKPNRLFDLTETQKRKLIRAFERVDPDQLTEAQQTDALVEAVGMLRETAAPPPMVRRGWLELAYAVLSPEEETKVRDMVASEVQTRMAADPAAQDWEHITAVYREKKPDAFNRAITEYRATRLAGVPAQELLRTRIEVMYNRFAPFYQCTGLYVFGFLLAMIGFVLHVAEGPRWASALRRSATFVLVLTLVVHTVALVSRMYIMDRPLVFVTNLYSSAVFIGWGCVALCLVLERLFPIGVGNVVAAVLGLATTIVAHNLGTQDTLEMMEAVLDTNFWLATHVTTVTLGYTATFVAGFLGALYLYLVCGAVIRDSYQSTGEPTVGALLAFGAAAVGVVGVPLAFLGFMTLALDKFEVVPHDLLMGVFYLALAAGVVYCLSLMLLRVSALVVDERGKPLVGAVPGIARPVAALALTPESGKILGHMVYGVVCFATMLSFIGTVLGGIWADQSWGRFWGWDPKENGAVLIVLWNSLILHARWAGLAKDRGVAALAVFGNAITAWSWFGTNQLGIGLHAYGFDSRLADGCFNFWLSQLFILAIGASIPRLYWASAVRSRAVPVPAPAAVPIKDEPPLPVTSPNGSVNAANHANGHASNAANRQPNEHPRRDKGKKHGKRR